MASLPPLDPRKPMDGLTRRTLLKASCGLGATGVLAGAAAVSWDHVMHRAATTPLAGQTPILVLVTLYGGNDGLNTVVPYADSAYHDLRPDLAYKAEDVLRLDDQLGLNPGLKGLADLWKQKQLTIVRGVGYPQPDHSHFRSMDIWQTAAPEAPVASGWIGRWLDASGDDPLLALNIGDVLPPLAVGVKATAAALSLKPAAQGAAARAALAAFATVDPRDTAAAQQVVASYAAVGRVQTTFAAADSATAASSATGTDSAPDPGGKGGLGEQLALVARCIKAGAPTRVYSVSLSGFDTHADEKTAQTIQLTQLDQALTSFRAALAGHPREKDVTTVAYSEFGRRVAANASEGTDHGTASNVFVMGESVSGGYVGDQPSLTDLDNGDLKSTVDFRAVYADLLRSVLGADPNRVLDKPFAPLGLIA